MVPNHGQGEEAFIEVHNEPKEDRTMDRKEGWERRMGGRGIPKHVEDKNV